MSKEEIESRVLEEARFIIEHHATVRQTAKQFGFSKSTVHKDIVERLPDYSFLLADLANKVLAKNKAERAYRGGKATQQKYLLLKNEE